MLNLIKIVLIAEVLYTNVLLEQSEQNPFLLNFQQSDYKLKVERVEISKYNKEYLKDVECKTFKYNRTCTAFNVSTTYKVDVENELEIVFQAYKFASNEYRLFPLRFQVKLCDMVSVHILGLEQYSKCGNFTGCPIKKGTKHAICNFTPDSSKFPPLIPSGKYKWQLTFLYHSVEVLVANAYAEVYRPFTGI